MRKKLCLNILYIIILLVCNITNIYILINNSIDTYELELFFIVIIIAMISQAVTCKLLFIDISNKVLDKVRFYVLIISQAAVCFICISTDNLLIGKIMLMTFGIIAVFAGHRRIEYFFKPKKKNYKRSIKYIKKNYPDAVIHKEDKGFEEYNGEYVKFFIGEKKKRERYYIFIDIDGNLTDTYLESKKSKENLIV